jgi:hypothetical protein
VEKTDDATAAIVRGAYATAAADARSAHSLNPAAPDPLYALGLAESLRGRLVVVEGERALARRFDSLLDFAGADSFAGARYAGAEP